MNTNDQMFREDIMEIYKNPANRGIMDNPTVSVLEVNPFCGDEVNLQLKVREGIIEEAKFIGSACMISIVSSSFLTEAVTGKSLEEVKKFQKDDLLKIINLNLTTSRVKCATLVLDALYKAIKEYESTTKS